MYTYLLSAGVALVFSVDDVFSYNVVDLLGIIPLGPTVRLPFVGSYFAVLLRGFAGLDTAIKQNHNFNFN